MKKPPHQLPSFVRWLFAGMILALCYCGESVSDNPAFTGLTGTSWVGTYSPGKQLTNVDPESVRLNLNKDKSFEIIRRAEEAHTAAKGTFTEMPKHQNVMLAVEESSFSLFGSPGKTYDYQYSYQGDELIMSNQKGKYILVEDATVEEQNLPFAGTWKCRSKDGGDVKINISDNSSFRAEKTVKGKTIFFEGKTSPLGQEEDSSSIQLEVLSASEDRFVGAVLRMRSTKDEDKTELDELDQKFKPISTTFCFR